MNDITISMLDQAIATMNEIFGKPDLGTKDPGAPREADYADRATWIDACAEHERKLNLAAGEATVGQQDDEVAQ